MLLPAAQRAHTTHVMDAEVINGVVAFRTHNLLESAEQQEG